MIDQSENALGIVAGLLEARTGQRLTKDRLWRVGTALTGVLRQNELESIEELADRLGRPNDGALAQQVVEALLNNETYFFRDRAMFDQLAVSVLPTLARKREQTRRLSIWSVGCSTGQETYSLAMLIAEQPARWRDWTIDIVGTDVARSVITGAREGSFSQFQIQRGLGVAQMVRFFEETRTGWRATDALRQMVRFETHNLLDQPPEPGRFDLICAATCCSISTVPRASAPSCGWLRRWLPTGWSCSAPARRPSARPTRWCPKRAAAASIIWRSACRCRRPRRNRARRGASGSADQGKSGVTEP
jgi:chemotaxis protein methyltransferase CheR